MRSFFHASGHYHFIFFVQTISSMNLLQLYRCNPINIINLYFFATTLHHVINVEVRPGVTRHGAASEPTSTGRRGPGLQDA
jgi:hypothetical protein